MDSGLFAWSATIVYSRELLDFWLYQVAMLSATFRSAYESSTTISGSPGALYSRLGRPLVMYRRQASEVFAAFLSVIAYEGDIALRGLFACAECEQVQPDGTTVSKGIVMDGTVTGILGKLPKFERPSVLDTAKYSARQQFLLPTIRLRHFMDSLFRSAVASSIK